MLDRVGFPDCWDLLPGTQRAPPPPSITAGFLTVIQDRGAGVLRAVVCAQKCLTLLPSLTQKHRTQQAWTCHQRY